MISQTKSAWREQSLPSSSDREQGVIGTDSSTCNIIRSTKELA